MKKLFGLAIITAALSAGSIYAAEETVDFRAVNPVLQSLIDAVTSADDLVDFAYPRFDESFCDLKAEKLKYDVQGALKNTPWMEGGRGEVTATSTYVADRSPGKTGVIITASANIKTDMLALIRYWASTGLRKTKPPTDERGKRVYAHLKRFAVSTTLNHVYELLLSFDQLLKDEMATYIQETEKLLICIQDGSCYSGNNKEKELERLKNSIAESKQAMLNYQQFKIEAKKDKDQVTEISLSLKDISSIILPSEKAKKHFTYFPGLGLIQIKTDSINMKTDAFVRVEESELNQFKSKYEKKLIGVQNGAYQDKDDAQELFRKALIDFKKAIRGEN